MPDSEHEPDIETGADTLLDFLEEKSRYSVSQISEDLGIPEDQVEKWARALENSGLVEIDYSAIKGMVLEYASDKSVDELNQGRHELSLETDTVEINVEDIEEAHEAAEEGKSEAGFVEKEEEDEKDTEDKAAGGEEKEAESGPSGSGSGSGREGSQESVEDHEESEDSSEGESIDLGDSESEGTETSTDSEESGSSVSISEKDSDEESESPGVTMKAKKAMLNKMNRGKSGSESEKSEEPGGSGEESVDESPVGSTGGSSSKNVSDEIDSNLSHVKSKSSGKYKSEEDIDWNPGDDVGEVDQNIRELSDLLLDPEVDDEEVYERIDYQTEVLKDKLKEEPLEERDNEEELREDIIDTIDILNKKIEESDSAKSKIRSLIRTLKQYFSKIIHAIGIQKVDQ